MTLRDTSRGLRRTYMAEVTCRRCQGWGFELIGYQPHRCVECEGQGTVFREREIPDLREAES